MKILYRLFLFLPIILPTDLSAQKLEFGFALQQNFNRFAEIDRPAFHPSFRTFSIDGASSLITGDPVDTLDVYMNKFSLEDNFEIPLFFRYQFKNRFFIEVLYSSSANELNIDGNTNYTDYYFVKNYGSYDEFNTQAIADGHGPQTINSYNEYIAGYKHVNIGDISMTERFRLTTLSLNFGMKLFPHKSIRPFFSSGFSWKNKQRKQLYQYLNFTHYEVRNYAKVTDGLDTYSNNTYFLNFISGLEFYRFRLSIFGQVNFIGSSLTDGKTNGVVINLNTEAQTFESAVSFGFNLSSTLFGKYLGKDVHYDELSDETIAISNIKKKKLNWSIGARLNNRLTVDLTGFYDDDSSSLHVVQIDTALLGNAGSLQDSWIIQAVTFGKIKRINWRPPIEVFGEYHFSKRFFLTGSIGFSALSFDIQTEQFSAVITADSLGVKNFVTLEDSPSLRPGVYRKNIGITTLTHVLNFNIVENPTFALRIFGGVGIAGMISAPFTRITPPGVNDLSIYGELDRVYQGIPESTDLLATTDPLNIKPTANPAEMLAKFPKTLLDETFVTPEAYKFSFNFIRTGFEVAIDRYTISAMFEMNLRYMDGFMLNDFRSIMLGIGYRFINR
ncbi:hypothetical protein JYT74_00495 [Crocinitomix catalasitica]|nr:hypothetical protein [Crocinitomix catalasitica]